MKKYLKVLVLIILLTIRGTVVFANNTTLQSSTSNLSQSTGQTTQSSTSDSTSQSTSAVQSSSQTANQSVAATGQTTPASTTTQQPIQNGTPTPAAQNPTQSSSPASSTTIIKETVNNNNKNSTNIWLIVLSSLSALVTIIGGVIAVIRHFRNRLTKSKPSFVNTSVVHSTSVVGKTDAVKTQEPVGYQSQRHLTETQQMKRAADQILKENKHKTSFRRSRR